MNVLGKVQLQGKLKELLLKEEDNFFKYYSLEIIGAYLPQINEQSIIFNEKINLSMENKKNIMQLLNKNKLKENETLKIIGTIEISKTKKEILIKRESQEFKLYYLNLIGVYSPKIPGNAIIFKEDTLENVVSVDLKDNSQKNKISPTEKEEIEHFLTKIKVLDLINRTKTEQRGYIERTGYNKTIYEDEINEKNQKKSISKANEKETLKMQQKQPKKVENRLGDINIKQEVNMQTRVTDMKNLEQVLQKNKKIPKMEYGDSPLKMGIVESDDLKNLKNEKGEQEQGHSSRYETVIITKKGKIKTLDLENDMEEGTNPLEKNYQVKQDGTVQKEDSLTRLKVGEGTISMQKGKYGEVEVYHSPRKTIGGKDIEGNKSLDRQLETSNSKNALEGTNIETLKLAQEYNDGYRSVEEGYQEIEQHKKQHQECEEIGIEDVDGDPNTISHTHDTEEYVELSTGEKVTYNELATRWGLYKDGKPDKDYVKEKFNQKENKKAEEVIEELDEEYQDPRAPEGRD